MACGKQNADGAIYCYLCGALILIPLANSATTSPKVENAGVSMKHDSIHDTNKAHGLCRDGWTASLEALKCKLTKLAVEPLKAGTRLTAEEVLQVVGYQNVRVLPVRYKINRVEEDKYVVWLSEARNRLPELSYGDFADDGAYSFERDLGSNYKDQKES
jgi:hypothetical protein